MEFKVWVSEDDERHFHGDSSYEIEGPVLTVWDVDSRRRTVFGPAGWVRIEVDDVDEPREVVEGDNVIYPPRRLH